MGKSVLEPVHNSQLTAARRCLRQYRYAYLERLEPLRPRLPLTRGIWIHYCLQAESLRSGLEKGSLLEVPTSFEIEDVGTVQIDLGVNEDDDPQLTVLDGDGVEISHYDLSWEGMLELLTAHVWMRLFPEEQEDYYEAGMYLPEAVRRILRGYHYHWRKQLDGEEPLLVEASWQRTHEESGFVFEGRIDLLVRNERGLVVLRDWKSTSRAPSGSWKLRESQLHIYPWGIAPKLQALGIDRIDKIEFDWILTKPPTKPQQNKDGSLSKRQIDTDAITYYEALKEYGIEITAEHKRKIKELLKQDKFLFRDDAPRSKKVTDQILDEAVKTSWIIQQIHDRPELGEVRSARQSCEWDCDFTDLCLGELYGQDTSPIRKKSFRVNPTPKARETDDE